MGRRRTPPAIAARSKGKAQLAIERDRLGRDAQRTGKVHQRIIGFVEAGLPVGARIPVAKFNAPEAKGLGEHFRGRVSGAKLRAIARFIGGAALYQPIPPGVGEGLQRIAVVAAVVLRRLHRGERASQRHMVPDLERDPEQLRAVLADIGLKLQLDRLSRRGCLSFFRARGTVTGDPVLDVARNPVELIHRELVPDAVRRKVGGRNPKHLRLDRDRQAGLGVFLIGEVGRIREEREPRRLADHVGGHCRNNAKDRREILLTALPVLSLFGNRIERSHGRKGLHRCVAITINTFSPVLDLPRRHGFALDGGPHQGHKRHPVAGDAGSRKGLVIRLGEGLRQGHGFSDAIRPQVLDGLFRPILARAADLLAEVLQLRTRLGIGGLRLLGDRQIHGGRGQPCLELFDGQELGPADTVRALAVRKSVDIGGAGLFAGGEADHHFVFVKPARCEVHLVDNQNLVGLRRIAQVEVHMIAVRALGGFEIAIVCGHGDGPSDAVCTCAGALRALRIL